jgi:Na+/H+-translocating membrane pyrophosphatase
MMKLVIGIVIGALIYYYFPSQVETAVKKAEEVIHEGASKAAEVTKPKSALDNAIDTVKEAVK